MDLSVEIMAPDALPQTNSQTTSMRQVVRNISEEQRVILTL
jgi:hypothetical protein